MDVDIQTQSVYICGESTNEGNNNSIAFWKENYNFLFISTIKKKSTITLQTLADYLEEGRRKGFYDYVIYNSFGIGDKYILWKSNSIASILSAIQCLYENRFISYEHTIFALDYYNVSDESKFQIAINQTKEEMIDSSFVLSNLLPIKCIDSNMFFYKESINESPQIETKRIFESIHHFFCSDNRAFENDPLKVWQGQFRNEFVMLSSESAESKKLNVICKHLFERLKNAKKILEIGWLDETIELARIMVTMSNNYIFESPCYLLLDSINLFCDWLDYIIKKQNNSNSYIIYSDDEIQFFIRAWNRLLENVVGTDGISLKAGKNSPFLYNICYTVIEYCRVYFDKLSKFLMDIEHENASLRFACIITPKLCRRIKTMELFYEDQSKDSLLAVEVPVATCYDPFLILTSLTHESAHYCGTIIRQKAKRQKVFIFCISKILCDSLGITGNSALKKVINIVTTRANANEREYYLSELKDKISKIVLSILHSNIDMNEIVSEVILITPNEKRDEVLDQIIINTNNLTLGDYSISGHIDRIELLLKECLADIIMMYILNLSMSDYLKVLSLELNKLSSNDTGKIKTVVQRILIVRKTCINNSIDFNSQIKMHPVLSPWLIEFMLSQAEMFDKQYDLFEKSQSVDAAFFDENDYTLDIYYSIIDYLSTCWKTLEQMIFEKSKKQNIEKLNELREIYNHITKEDKFGADAIGSIITKYRSQIMNNYNEDGSFILQHEFE